MYEDNTVVPDCAGIKNFPMYIFSVFVGIGNRTGKLPLKMSSMTLLSERNAMKKVSV